jgi:hypothetical protein
VLPDFVKAKNEAKKSLMTLFRAVVNSEPLLANITKRTVVCEGDKFTVGDDMGEVATREFTRIGAEFSVSREDIINKGIVAHLEALKRPAEEMQAQQAKMVIDGLNRATEKTGNKVETQGKQLDFDLFIEGLSVVQIDFEPDGTPRLPSLLIHPSQGARIAELIKEWEANPECDRRMKEVIEQKRAEWNARESSRRLVD